jgi:hypothetical protein
MNRENDSAPANLVKEKAGVVAGRRTATELTGHFFLSRRANAIHAKSRS